jgi:hypothetical protein
MQAILALMASAESRSALAFLFSELRSGVSYFAALSDGEITEADVLAAWARGHGRFMEGEAAVDKALAERAKARGESDGA